MMSKRSLLVLAATVAGVSGLVLWQTPIVRNTRSAAWSAWVQTVGRWAGFGSLEVDGRVESQLTALRSENTRLQAELLEYRVLKKQLAAPAWADYRTIAAQVAARPLDPWQSEYILSKGARDGVVLEAPVVIGGNTLVGFISELNEKTSVLRLLFHPATNLAADVLVGEEIKRGLAQGRTFTAVELTSVPRDAPLQIGQEVVTAAQGSQTPFGLVIGEIEKIIDEKHDPFRAARLAVKYEAEDLRAVHILVAP